jgi:predicted amidohydrolase YtcJ
LLQDYHNRPGFRIQFIRPQEELDELVAKYQRLGLQMNIHANGDAAIESVISAFEKAQAACPRPDLRHMIIHCQMATEDHIARMKDLEIIPSYFPNHVYYWGDRHEHLFIGPERAARINPIGSSSRAGLRFTLHADTPVTPVSPLHSIHCAVNRVTRQGKVLGPDQRITPYEALEAYTTNAAYCSFEENSKGSLRPGLLADFIVLSDNPLTVDPMKIKDIAVLETRVGGDCVHRA